MQALYNLDYVCNGTNAKKTIETMLNLEHDSTGVLVLIGLHSKELNKRKYNRLFKILAKDVQDKYRNTYLYYAIKSIERENKNFLTQQSLHIAQILNLLFSHSI